MGEHQVGVAMPGLEDIAKRLGAIVRADVGDISIRATLLLGYGVPVLTLNVVIVGTDLQEVAALWAMAVMLADTAGFHLHRSTDAARSEA